MTTRLRTFTINAALVLCSLIFTFLCLEVVIRVFFPGSLNNQEIRTYDPQLSYKFLPDLDTIIDTGTGKRHLITNSHGYIGEEFPTKKPAGEFRIIHIGDSYTEGVQEVDWDRNYVARIGDLLSGSATTAQTYGSINLGVSGRGQVEEYWVYKYFGSTIDPDLTILWVTEANDIGNNDLPNGPPGAAGQNSYGTIKYIIKKSAFATFLFDRVKRDPDILAVLQRLHLTNARYDPIESGFPPREEMINYSILEDDASSQERAYASTRALFVDLKHDIKRDGGELLVVLIPHFTDIEAYRKEFSGNFPKANIEDYDFEKPHRFFTTMLDEEGITHFDLASPLAQYEAGKSGMPDCGGIWGDHFTACGHEVTANILASYIREHYLK